MKTSGWDGLLRMLDEDASADTLPILPASHNGHADVLLMTRANSEEGRRDVLHLWPAPIRLEPEGTSVWQGTLATASLEHRFGLLSFWMLEAQGAAGLDAFARSLDGLRRRKVQRSPDAPVLLLRERPSTRYRPAPEAGAPAAVRVRPEFAAVSARSAPGARDRCRTGAAPGVRGC